MAFQLKFAEEAAKQYSELSQNKQLEKRFKAVQKALRMLSENPRHPGLQTHKYESIVGPNSVEVFEAYAEQKTPAAHRIFWCYHPPKTKTKTIISIRPHP